MRPALLAAGLLGLAACVPLYDPMTVADLTELKNPATDTARCHVLLEAERAKQGPARDPNTIRHFEEICHCLDTATDEAQRQTCVANLDAYLAYEEAKR